MHNDEAQLTPQYVATTDDVRVSVVPEYIEENSDVQSDSYAFAYTITIENLGSETVQLLERHWIVMSAGTQIAEVNGPGVVGVQPVLKKGERFEYTSGAIIHDPTGSMHGAYTFRREDGSLFNVQIPKFDLVYPMIIH